MSTLTPFPTTFNQYEDVTRRELDNMYGMRLDNPGFFGKLGIAAKYETMTGQLLQELNDPNFTPDPTFSVNQVMLDRYAGDITEEETIERIVGNSRSFGEFIFNVDNVRRSLKKRRELFEGNAFDAFGGFVATIIPNLVEMVPATVAATALAGPIGGGAAFVDRAYKTNRVLGALKGIGIAGVVDLPIEYTKYSLDESLTQKQFLTALATAGVMGGAFGAAFPSTLFKVSKAIKNELRLEEAIKISNNFGDAAAKASARKLSKGRRLSTRAEDVATGTTQLEGRITVRKYLTSDVIENLRKGFDGVLPTAVTLGAKNLGVVGSELNQLVQAAFKQLPTKGALTGNKQAVRDAIKNLRAKLKEDGAIDNLLAKAERGEQTTVANAFFSMAKESEKLAATGVQLEVTKLLRKVAGAVAEGKRVDLSDLDKGLAALQKRIQRNDMFEVTASRPATRFEIADDEVARGLRTATDDAGETTIMVDGVPVATGSSDLVELSAEDLAKAASTQSYRMRVMEGFRDEGFREGLARAIDIFDIPGTGGVLTSRFVKMMRSDSQEIRDFASIFFSGPRQKGSALPVEVIIRTNVERSVTKVSKKMNLAKINAAKRGVQISDQDISRAVTTGATPSGELGQAVKAVREFYKDLHGYGVRGGVFEDIPFDPKYIQRRYNDVRTVAMIDEFGEDTMLNFIGSAIKRAPRKTPLNNDQARKVAQRILDYNKNPKLYGRWRKDSAEAFDVFEKQLRRDLDGLSEEQIKDIMDMVAPQQAGNPHLGMTYRRIAMDENYSASMTGKNGTRTVHIDELMDRDLNVGLTLYAQRVIGATELRRGFKAFRPDSDEVMTLSQMDAALLATGDAQARTASKSLDALYRFNMGFGFGGDESIQEMMKHVRDGQALAMANFGSMMGVAQMPEIASVVFRNGARSAAVPLTRGTWWKQIGRTFTMGPEKLRNKAVYGTPVLGEGRRASGELADDILAELETFTGVGGDMIRGDYITRRLDMMEGEAGLSGSIRGKLSNYIDTTRQVAIMNPFGILPADTVLRRWMVESAFQGFVNRGFTIAKAGGIKADMGFFGGGARRMFKETGMSDEMIDRVIKELTRPDGVAKVEKGVFGNYKVKKIDFEKVQDKAAMDNFAIALRRHVDRGVQRNYLGDMPLILDRPVVRALMQFRVFSIVSKSKQLGYSVAGMDGRMAMNVVGGAFLGMLGYKILHWKKSLGMSEVDRMLYLNDKFSTANLVRAGVTRSSVSTVGPMMVDTMRDLMGADPVFNQRTTMGASGIVTGSTLFQMGDQAMKSTKEIMSAIAGNDDYSQQDLKNLARFGGLLSVPFLSEAITKGFEQIPIPEED